MMMKKLEWAARALAQPHDVQESLFPDFVEVADELALSWEEAFWPFEKNPSIFSAEFSEEQQQAILELNRYMGSISGEDHLDLWTMKALAASDEWKLLRKLARRVLTVMKWPPASPPASDGNYVGGGSQS
jgi:hypothetical protein